MASYLIQILFRNSDIAAELASLGRVHIYLREADKPEVRGLIISPILLSVPGREI